MEILAVGACLLMHQGSLMAPRTRERNKAIVGRLLSHSYSRGTCARASPMCVRPLQPQRRLQVWTVVATLSSPSKAFLPCFRQTPATPGLLAPEPRARAPSGRHPRQAPLHLCRASSSHRAREAAQEAVQQAGDELDRVAAAAGDAASGVAGDEVQATVAAARAAARRAMEALQRGGSGDPAANDVFSSSPREDVVLPARAAVEAALSAMAAAETAIPASEPAFTAASDAIDAAQSALDRRIAAASELGTSVVGNDEEPTRAYGKGGGVNDDSDGASGGGGGGVDSVYGGDDVLREADEAYEGAELTKEPDSARTTRNNPAASHSHLSHLLWRQVAGPGDTVVDCTAGNGHDTLELAKTVALNDGVGRLYAMDVQERALEATRERLEAELGAIAVKRSTLVKANFRRLPAELEPASVQLIVYNLGWLPGGDKSITTKLEDTLESIGAAQRLVKSGGMISVMLYRGHEEGKRESEAVLEYVRGLSHFQWRVFVHERANRPASPVLVTVYRL